MMALLEEISPNIQEIEGSARKRSHDEYVEVVGLEHSSNAKGANSSTRIDIPARPGTPCSAASSALSTPISSPNLTEAGSSTPAQNSPGPQTPKKTNVSRPVPSTEVAITSAVKPQVKRKKLTFAEKEAEKAAKQEEKDKKAAEKAAKQKEKEDKAAAKAAEKAARDAEKAKKEEEKAAAAKDREEKRAKLSEREEKRRQKQEKQNRLREDEEKKERNQMKLGNFFSIAKTPKNLEGASEDLAQERLPYSPKKSQKTRYELFFQPFFVKENTRWKRSIIDMDDEAIAAKSRVVEEAILNQHRNAVDVGQFDAASMLNLSIKPAKRGRRHEHVKHVMEKMYRDFEAGGNKDSENAARIHAETRRVLATIPFKIIAFSSDVRPPYYGTASLKTSAVENGDMKRLARASTKKRLPLDYAYDSEAEWQDEEDGEDLDAEDDEEELDEEDDMEGFLDDSEDVGVHRRLFVSNLEVENTGICYEGDSTRRNDILHSQKLRIVHEGLPTDCSIDPFSTQYWQPKQHQRVVSLEQDSMMAPPSGPATAFAAVKGGANDAKRDKMVKAEILDKLKMAILENETISKAGMVEVMYNKFRSEASRAEIKNTIEHVAERAGPGRQKKWELKREHQISV